jgi:hypothetical protein
LPSVSHTAVVIKQQSSQQKTPQFAQVQLQSQFLLHTEAAHLFRLQLHAHSPQSAEEHSQSEPQSQAQLQAQALQHLQSTHITQLQSQSEQSLLHAHTPVEQGVSAVQGVLNFERYETTESTSFISATTLLFFENDALKYRVQLLLGLCIAR